MVSDDSRNGETLKIKNQIFQNFTPTLTTAFPALSDTDEEGADEIPPVSCLTTIHLVVYSVDSRESFTHATQILYRLYEGRRRNDSMNSEPPPAIILVGNKADLERRRKVTRVEGKMLAKIYKCPHMECSALRSVGVDQLWEEALKRVQKHKLAKERALERGLDGLGSPLAGRRGGGSGGGKGVRRRCSINSRLIVRGIVSGTRRFAKSCEELVARIVVR